MGPEVPVPEKTLYASADERRFFHIPDDVVLPAGAFTIRSLSGRAREVDPVVLDVFEVPEAEAQALARAAMEAWVETGKKMVAGVTTALRDAARGQPTAATPPSVDAQYDRAADALGVTREQLHGDPKAVLAGLTDALKGIAAVARESIDPASAADGKQRMEALAARLRKDGLPADAATTIEELPETLRQVLGSAELEQTVRDASRRLTELSAQLDERKAPKTGGGPVGEA
jgi:hypothetical protein